MSHYKKEGFDFLLKVFDTPNFLEELTGLDKLHASVEDGQVSMGDNQVGLGDDQVGRVMMIKWVWMMVKQ